MKKKYLLLVDAFREGNPWIGDGNRWIRKGLVGSLSQLGRILVFAPSSSLGKKTYQARPETGTKAPHREQKIKNREGKGPLSLVVMV